MRDALEDAQEALIELWGVLCVQKGADKSATGEYIIGARSVSVPLVKRVRAVLASASAAFADAPAAVPVPEGEPEAPAAKSAALRADADLARSALRRELDETTIERED